MPVFTVVIPLYNKAGYIKNTLSSVYAQTFTDFEVIVVNDGSTDGSGDLFKNHTYNRLTYFQTENRGVSSARNTGINNASGQLIAFLDADDEWLPGHLDELYRLHTQHPEAGMVISRYSIKNPGSSKLQKPTYLNLDESFSGIIPDFFGSSLVNHIAWTCVLAVPLQVFRVTGGFSENVTHPEDTEMWIKIATKYPVALGSNYTAIYNFEVPQSLSKRNMEGRKLMDFTAFLNLEAKNPSLKAFIDNLRLEYALKFRAEGNIAKSNELYWQTAKTNVSTTKKILFKTSPITLRILLTTKRWLFKKGIHIPF